VSESERLIREEESEHRMCISSTLSIAMNITKAVVK